MLASKGSKLSSKILAWVYLDIYRELQALPPSGSVRACSYIAVRAFLYRRTSLAASLATSLATSVDASLAATQDKTW